MVPHPLRFHRHVRSNSQGSQASRPYVAVVRIFEALLARGLLHGAWILVCCSMADQACGSNYEAPIRLINKEASRSHRLVGLQRVAASLGRRCHVRRSRALHCRWLQWSHQRLGVRNLTVRPSSRWRVKLSCCPGRWRLQRLRRKLLALRLVLSGLRQYRLSRLLWRRVVLTDLVLRWAELSDLLWRRVRLPGLLWWRVRLPVWNWFSPFKGNFSS